MGATALFGIVVHRVVSVDAAWSGFVRALENLETDPDVVGVCAQETKVA